MKEDAIAIVFIKKKSILVLIFKDTLDKLDTFISLQRCFTRLIISIKFYSLGIRRVEFLLT